jgi:hypothetical protein
MRRERQRQAGDGEAGALHQRVRGQAGGGLLLQAADRRDVEEGQGGRA